MAAASDFGPVDDLSMYERLYIVVSDSGALDGAVSLRTLVRACLYQKQQRKIIVHCNSVMSAGPEATLSSSFSRISYRVHYMIYASKEYHDSRNRKLW